MIYLYILLGLLWYASGVASFIWWWTKDHDFMFFELLLPLLLGALGPITFPMGWLIHGDSPNSVVDWVLVKKRK